MIQDSAERQVALYRKAAKHWTDRRKVNSVATAMAGVVMGYVVQSAFADTEIDPAGYSDGIALLG